MDTYGVTIFGVTDPIKDMIRKDYVEPQVQGDLIEMEKQGKLRKPFYEIISEIDCYVGKVDGYAYRSYDRLARMRKKGNFKPVGPLEMYNYAGCTSMQPGWWTGDPALEGELWWYPPYRYVKNVSEQTKFIDFALRVDKAFRQ
ncbi:uncharacterized protein [Onthophagus taurus]|uniref:uncharacterized protein n=1 Tax=Onthophagus taurus TaxID=166361 RepID=UPI000C206330|nr:uncharacterized protein LOC111422830 [Onthophagus taurus]